MEKSDTVDTEVKRTFLPLAAWIFFNYFFLTGIMASRFKGVRLQNDVPGAAAASPAPQGSNLFFSFPKNNN